MSKAPDVAPDAVIVATLRELLIVSHDGEAGYQHAALRVEDEALREAFLARAHQRAEFSGEIQECLHRYGWDGHEGGSAAASLHRRWVSAKAAFHKGDSQIILEECERGDRVALATYERTLLRPELPRDVLSLLERQWSQLFEVCARYRWLAGPPAAVLHGAPLGAKATVAGAWTRLVDRYRFWETKLEIEACALRQPEHMRALLDRLGLESLVHWRLVEEEVFRALGYDHRMKSVGRHVSANRVRRLNEDELGLVPVRIRDDEDDER